MKSGVTTVVNRIADVRRAIDALTRNVVLVGYPAANNARLQKGQPITNAALGYIHEHGAPAAGIPARPHLFPGVADEQPSNVKRFESMARAAMEGRPSAVERGLNAVGLATANAVKRRITEGPFVPLAESTLRARAARGRAVKVSQAMLQKRQKGIAVKSSAHAAATGARPLIDTGQLRNAVTYVIRRGRA